MVFEAVQVYLQVAAVPYLDRLVLPCREDEVVLDWVGCDCVQFLFVRVGCLDLLDYLIDSQVPEEEEAVVGNAGDDVLGDPLRVLDVDRVVKTDRLIL